MKISPVEYTPSGETLRRFHLDNKNRVRCMIGPFGSGKTTATCMEIFIRACQQAPNEKKIRETRWLIIRRTYPELHKSTIKSWERLFPSSFGKYSFAEPVTHYMQFQLEDKTTVKAEVVFMALDGPRAEENIHGSEWTGIWINEAKEVAKPIIDVARGRVGRFPAIRDGGPTWFGIIMDTNPPDDDHWLYRLAEKEKPEGWGFYKQPGGVKLDEHGKWVSNPDAENTQFLPPGYYVDQMAGQTEDYIKVNLGGEYGYVREGRPVFPEYSDTAHVADLKPVPGLPLHIGADWGLTPAAVIGQRLSDGRVLILKEIVSDGIGAVRFAEILKRVLADDFRGYPIAGLWGDPAGAQKAQTDERTVFQIMRNAGLPFQPAPGQKPTIRREAVAKMLTRMVDGKTGFLVDRACTMLRGALAGKYCYKRILVTEERYADTPIKNEYSHIADGLQYFALGIGEGRALLTDDRGIKPNVLLGNRNRPKVLMRVPR